MKPYAITFTNNYGTFTYVVAGKDKRDAITNAITKNYDGLFDKVEATPIHNDFEISETEIKIF